MLVATIIIIASLISLALLYFLVRILPEWLVKRDLPAGPPGETPGSQRGGEDPSHPLTPAERLKATNDVRTSLLQSMSALVLVVGLVVTASQVTLTQRASQQTLQISREQNQSARFSDAVSRLGAKTPEERLGAVLILKRFVALSDTYNSAPWQVLEGFLQYELSRSAGSGVGKANLPASDMSVLIALRTVIRFAHDKRHAKGREIDLSHLLLQDAQLQHANLSMADLSHAQLTNADLEDSTLKGADLDGANLNGSNLAGADLSEASIANTSFDRATADASTQWPEAFDPVSAGVTLLH